MVNVKGYSSRIALSDGASGTNWVVKNNLWYCNTSCGAANNTVNGQLTYDNNWYSGASYTSGENGLINGGSENPFTNVSTYDFTLKAASGPIDQGTDLSGVFTTDYAGNTRTGTWDIGAYEYGAGLPTSAQGFTISGGSVQ